MSAQPSTRMDDRNVAAAVPICRGSDRRGNDLSSSRIRKMDHSHAERTLETPRLVLEPLLPRHARLLFADLSDPSRYTLIPRDPPNSVEALEQRFHRLAARSSPDGREVWLNWVARLRGSGEFVGTVEATVHPEGRAHLAYTVFRRFWRRGFAKESCECVVESLFADCPS